MEMRGQNKEIEMPTTLGYNRDSSSKLKSPTLGERSDHQRHTLIFNDPPQTSQSRHHHLIPLAPTQLHQSQKPNTDPDLTSSHIATTNITTTPIATISNTPRTAPPPPPPPTPTPLIRYRECLRNHAASMGSHVVDGCGEFMPSGEEGTPESLLCAACDCHRNFHRKEAEGASNYHCYYPNMQNNHNMIPSLHTPSSSLHQNHRFSHGVATPTSLIPPVMMAFGGSGAAAESSSEDLNMFQSNTRELSVQPLVSSKKRFRTKFTQQQKDRMMEFAEKLGWKIQKHDEQEVQQFCSQVGIRRQVFKVWMHNNKQAMKKQQIL